MGRKLEKIKEKLVNDLELPQDMILNLPKITIIAKKEITIENHKGIKKFSDKEIIINSSLGTIEISGQNLVIIFVGGSTVTISGTFSSIVYENNEEN